MSLIGNVNSGNNPYAGGSKTPNAPPPNLGGSIPSANTNNAPIQGVNPPGQPFYARNNEGSNIGIPYTRLVPLSGRKYVTGLIARQRRGGHKRYALAQRHGRGAPVNMEGTNDRQRLGGMQTITETEDMRATKIGFISAAVPSALAVPPSCQGARENDESYEYGNEDYSTFSPEPTASMASSPSARIPTGRTPRLAASECREPSASRRCARSSFSRATLRRCSGTSVSASGLGTRAELTCEGSPAGFVNGEKFRKHSGYNAEFVAALPKKILNATAVPDHRRARLAHARRAGRTSKIRRSASQAGRVVRDDGPFLRGKGITNSMLNGPRRYANVRHVWEAAGGLPRLAQPW